MVMNLSEQKPCESVFNCPYSRISVCNKTATKTKRKRKKDKVRTAPEIAGIVHYCVYKKERTEITSENRHKISCIYECNLHKID